MKPAPGKKRSFLAENLSLKVISIVLAVLLELYFYSADNSVRASLPATVHIRNIPQGMTIVRPEHADRGIRAAIEVRGPRPLIEQVRVAMHSFAVDYPVTSPPVYTAVLNPRQISLPPGVELVEVRPSSLTIEVERMVAKELPVRVDFEGEPKEGFRLEKIASIPAMITVRGPARFLDSLTEVLTQRVSVGDITEPKRFEVPLIAPDPRVVLSAQLATVEVLISAIPAEATFENVNVQVVAPHGFAASVQPSRVKTVLGGPAPVLERLESKSLVLRADARRMAEGKFELPLEADLPAGVSIIETKPKTVTVTLVKQNG